VGKYIVQALLEGGKHEVTAITRGDANVPEGVKAAKVSYDDPASLTKALEGQDVLIITMSVRAAPETQGKLIEAAAAAKVPFVLPNKWGIDSEHAALGTDTLTGPAATAAKNKIEELGVSSWIGMVTGYWYAYSLASPEAYGFDLAKKAVTFFDEGTAKVNCIVSLPSFSRVSDVLGR
jgi:uncharacterized protein YbjT (DUF2867 family)